LAASPNNADILLNLARVLFNLQYLDDAIFLTRRSLEVQPPDQNAWMQHFQLGEILKAYCHYQEAALHLRHVLELKPNYGPALAALQDMESIPNSSVHGYTVLIIIVLICVVLVWILGTLDIHISDLFWNDSATNGGGSASEGGNNGFKNKAARFQSKR
jgi:tetratricopeptide (TPR) repeat protein